MGNARGGLVALVTSNLRMIFDLYKLFTESKKRQFKGLVVLMLTGSVFEVMGVGAIIPFISFLVEPQKLFDSGVLSAFLNYFSITQRQTVVAYATVIFVLIILINGIIRILLLRLSTKFAFSVGADLSVMIYKKALYRSYLEHVSSNSSEIIDAIITKSNAVIYGTIMPAISIATASILTVSIAVFLIFVNPFVAIGSLITFSTIYCIIILYTKNKLHQCSDTLSKASIQIIKTLQEGLGGIRNVIIDNSQLFYCTAYKVADSRLRDAQGYSSFLGTCPRYVVETLAMLALVSLSYILTQKYAAFFEVVPLLAAMAVGAQRLLPLLQTIYGGVVDIRRGQKSLVGILEILNAPIETLPENVQTMKFQNDIEVRNLSFSYNVNSRSILHDVSLRIAKGANVGIIGETGGGKSTFIDILMGLLMPTSGSILVDGVKITNVNVSSWRKLIAHVPQDIFLSDCSIAENIALGINKDCIDINRIEWTCNVSCLDRVIADLPEGLWTQVGEKGIRLSGGQRQRIAIARALYKRSQIFIFDEATSALDSETESEVISNIERLSNKPTIIFVAHRLSTLKNCEQIYSVKDSKIFEVSKDALDL